MNWTGKILSYALALVFFLFYKKIPAQEFGFTLQQKENSGRFVGFVTLFLFILMLLFCFFFASSEGSSLENLLYQLTMPSVVEEIAVRGVMLGLLNQIFQRNWSLAGISFGMGVVITSILFGLWHRLNIGDGFAISFNWVPIIYTGLIGFILGLVMERTGSLLYPILLHIIVNMMPNLWGYIF